MLLNYIRSNRASYIVLLPIIGIGLWLQTFISGEITWQVFDKNPMPLYYLIHLLLNDYPFFYNLPAIALVFVMAFLILRINEKYMIIETRSYLVAFFLIVLQSALLPMNRLHPGLIAAVFLLFALDKLFDTYKEDSRFTNFFDAGLLISISSLFYFNSIYLIVAIWLGMVLLGNFSFRNWLLTILGILLPYFLCLSYFYVGNNLMWFLDTIESNFFLKNHGTGLNIADYVFFLFLLLMIILASFKVAGELQTSKISTRKYMRVLLVVFATILVLYFFISSASIEMLPVFAIPLSFLLSYYFIAIRSHWLGNILIVVFIILILGMQLFPVIYRLFI
ncbi:MAG: DUF6427 family protein [Bacteroidales bacterium]|nr:DUF6427 family protein [Bacteroidales bacterium]MCF8455214.1 DUF6427 family protein [Bacteroidales bacterium]